MKSIFFTLLIISFGFSNLVVAQDEINGNYTEEELWGEDFYEYDIHPDYTHHEHTGNNIAESNYSPGYEHNGSIEWQMKNLVNLALAKEYSVHDSQVSYGAKQSGCFIDKGPGISKEGDLGINVCRTCNNSSNFSLSCGF